MQLQSNLGGVVRTTALDQAFTIGTASYDFDFSGVVGSQIDVASVVSFSVARSMGTNGVVSVDYTRTASSAVAGVDFVGTSGTLVFPSGVSTQSFTVPLIGDSVCETTPQTFSDRLMQRASAT